MTPHSAAELAPSERVLFDRIRAAVAPSPYPDEAVRSSEVCFQLHDFRALHALKRKGYVEIEFDVEEAWIQVAAT